MKLRIKTKHSLSNKYKIEEWVSLEKNNVLGFVLTNKNEIYFHSDELSKYYDLKQHLFQIRDEVTVKIIEDLNEKLALNEIRISHISPVEEIILGGYKLNDLFSGIYIKHLDFDVSELFFDKLDYGQSNENNIDNVILKLSLILGTFSISHFDALKINDVYEIKPTFNVLSKKQRLFDYVLGINEIMIVKEDECMSLEDTIGENVVSNPEDLSVDLDIVLGKIHMSISDLKELLVGDFINVENLPLSKVNVVFNQKKLAVGELVYNEDEKLSLEIKEVYL